VSFLDGNADGDGMTVPLCIDLYCGLGGWAEGFLAEGYRVRGYDIEAHDYGSGGYPGDLVLRDVRSIHGSELADAACIVGSSPCQEFSYRAMPWKRAKALPPPYLGIELFNAQFRIQREAIEAAGHYIPLVVENVRGAQKWVGPARWHFGSYYLWGDVPALMPVTFTAFKSSGMNWSDQTLRGQDFTRLAGQHAMKTTSHVNIRDGYSHTRHLTNQRESDGVKQAGISGPRDNGKGDAWFQDGAARHGSKSSSRKAASAMIAKIPFALAQHIARTYKPRLEVCA
jgi:hypothetical protein